MGAIGFIGGRVLEPFQEIDLPHFLLADFFELDGGVGEEPWKEVEGALAWETVAETVELMFAVRQVVLIKREVYFHWFFVPVTGRIEYF